MRTIATINDLKCHGEAGVITPERAFTISELIVYRVRDEFDRDERERELLTRVADLISEVGRSWRS